MANNFIGYVWNIKEVAKTLIIAPAVASLGYMATSISVSYATAINAIPASTTTTYPEIAAGVLFALVLVLALDEMLVKV